MVCVGVRVGVCVCVVWVVCVRVCVSGKWAMLLCWEVMSCAMRSERGPLALNLVLRDFLFLV